jgi:F0F1-type ATP synthase delta subunit
MKYTLQDYARALDAVRNDPAVKPEVAVKNFLAILRRNGDEGHLKKILDEAVRMSHVNAGAGSGKGAAMRDVVIESARPLSKSQAGLIKNFLKPGDVVGYRVNPDLVAGMKITVNDETQFDGSMKAKLEALF